MLPLHDENPSRTVPYFTYTLIALNLAAFAFQLSLSGAGLHHLVHHFGVIPVRLVGAVTSAPTALSGPVLEPYVALATSLFLHGGWMHLMGNMLFLYVFGDNVEDELGHGRFLAFYLACGVLASAAHVAAEPTSTIPTIGASGAISGVLGAYLVMHPTARVTTIVWLGFFFRRVPMPAFVFLGLWFLLQSVSGWASLGAHHASAGGVAWFAHIGGFVAGALIGLIARGSGQTGRAPAPRRQGWSNRR